VNERSSRLAEPIDTQRSSTIIDLAWNIVGWYS